MEVYILDKNFAPICILDAYESLIWAERYNEYSDFELVIPMENAPLEFLRPDNYVALPGSNKTMIIEDIPIEDTADEGDRIILSGRSLESILNRRIIWEQKTVSANIESAVFSILDANIVNPLFGSRKVNNIILQASGDSSITSINIQSQYSGEEVYKTVEDICKTYDLGFKMELNNLNQMVFLLYNGVDRSFSQTERPPVIFSPSFDNLIKSKYIESTKTYKNVGLVAGEGEGSARKTTIVGNATISGLDRREIFIEAHVSSNNGDISQTDYLAQLETRGNEVLAEHTPIYTFEAETEPNGIFKHGRDYSVGDIVQLVNEYGIKVRARITEIVISHNTEGVSLIPTFVVI